jgi:hypothetical protein
MSNTLPPLLQQIVAPLLQLRGHGLNSGDLFDAHHFGPCGDMLVVREFLPMAGRRLRKPLRVPRLLSDGMRPRFVETESRGGFLGGEFGGRFNDRAKWIAHSRAYSRSVW